MERLFTSITNAEELAERINNDLHTGYYAGEREDYMMNGINLTENGLIKKCSCKGCIGSWLEFH